MVLLFLLLAVLTGALVYAFSPIAKIGEIGRIIFLAATLAILFALSRSIIP